MKLAEHISLSALTRKRVCNSKKLAVIDYPFWIFGTEREVRMGEGGGGGGVAVGGHVGGS